MVIRRLVNLLRRCRQPLVFLFFLLPLSMAFGYLFRQLAEGLRTVAMAGLSLYLLPSVPIVLCSITLAVDRLFSAGNDRNYLGRLLIISSLLAFGSALIGLFCAQVWHAGKLDEHAKMALGQFVGTGTQVIHVYLHSVPPIEQPEPLLNTLVNWIVPNNLMMHMTRNETLKIIMASLAFGVTIRLIPEAMAHQVRTLLGAVNAMSTQLLGILLDLSPLIITLLLASSFSKLNFGVVLGLTSFIAAFFAAAGVTLLLALLVVCICAPQSDVRAPSRARSVLDVFILGISTASSISLYSSIQQILQDWKIDGDQIDPAISVNLLVSRAGNIVYNIVAIFFALNLFDESITVALSGKAVLLAILTGLATAGLSGIAVVPVITMALEVMRVPSAPIIIPLLAIDPILGMVRAGITGVVALSGASLICSHAVPSRAGLMENGESV